jgi:hypothetical protein
MSKAFLSLILLFTMNFAYSQNYYCSQWKKQQGLSCVHAGRRADVWARQCENPCRVSNYCPECDLERICLDEDPNLLTSQCSEWKKDSSISCHNPSTGRWEQKWVRACTTGLATSWCSDEDPNRF